MWSRSGIGRRCATASNGTASRPQSRLVRRVGVRARALHNGSVHRYLAYGFVACASCWSRSDDRGEALVVVLQVVVVVAVAPVMTGVIRKVQARLEGRVGAPITQPWRDVRKLWRKERIAPESVELAVRARAAGAGRVLHRDRDDRSRRDARVADARARVILFAVVSLFLLATVFLALAGLDPGTAFGGMGASREMTIAALAEPTLLARACTRCRLRAGSTNLSEIVHATWRTRGYLFSVPSVFALVALAIAVARGMRAGLPVDNPRTHLELTMVHEAMVLEYAGPDLALVELAASMRLVLFGVLLANLFVPWGIARDVGRRDRGRRPSRSLRQVRYPRRVARRVRDVHTESSAVPGARAVGAVVCGRVPRRDPAVFL